MRPETTLGVPVRLGDEGAQGPLRQRVAASREWREREDRFLDVWGEEQQAEDLRDAGPSEACSTGDCREVWQFAGPQPAVGLVSERELEHDAG